MGRHGMLELYTPGALAPADQRISIPHLCGHADRAQDLHFLGPARSWRELQLYWRLWPSGKNSGSELPCCWGRLAAFREGRVSCMCPAIAQDVQVVFRSLCSAAMLRCQRLFGGPLPNAVRTHSHVAADAAGLSALRNVSSRFILPLYVVYSFFAAVDGQRPSVFEQLEFLQAGSAVLSVRLYSPNEASLHGSAQISGIAWPSAGKVCFHTCAMIVGDVQALCVCV